MFDLVVFILALAALMLGLLAPFIILRRGGIMDRMFPGFFWEKEL
jgi:hypothetical protein